jgi:hypothetical protein
MIEKDSKNEKEADATILKGSIWYCSRRNE